MCERRCRSITRARKCGTCKCRRGWRGANGLRQPHRHPGGRMERFEIETVPEWPPRQVERHIYPGANTTTRLFGRSPKACEAEAKAKLTIVAAAMRKLLHACVRDPQIRSPLRSFLANCLTSDTVPRCRQPAIIDTYRRDGKAWRGDCFSPFVAQRSAHAPFVPQSDSSASASLRTPAKSGA